MKPPSIEFIMIASRGIALLLALITLAWAFMRWRRDTTRDAQRVFEQLDLVRSELLELQGQMGSTASMRKAVPEYNAHASSSRQTQHAPLQQTVAYDSHHESRKLNELPRIAAPAMDVKTKGMTNAAPRGYEVAARLARNGASAEELMNTCALSRNEAELLVRLHAGMKSTQPPDVTGEKSNVSSASSLAHSNLNQLKNIGRGATAPKPLASARPVPVRSPAPQRISLVG